MKKINLAVCLTKVMHAYYDVFL